MLRKKIIAIIVISVLLLISLPLAIDWFIIGNDFPSNVNNSDWMSFLGGYVGAILSGAISLIGIIWTIKFTREQNRADRELQVRPCFDIQTEYVEGFCYTDDWLGYVIIDSWRQSESENKSNSVGSVVLNIRNIGNGAATNIDFKVFVKDDSIENYAYYNKHNQKVSKNSISPTERGKLTIDITNRAQPPKKEDYYMVEGCPFPMYDDSKFSFPERYSFRIEMLYEDLLSNRFTLIMHFDTSFYLSTNKDTDGAYKCDISLKKIETRK